jgi:hypothetical protein
MAQKNLSRYNRGSNKSHQSRSASLAENGLALRSRLVPTTDLLFENHFSLFLIRPVSPAGKTWLDENIGDENTLTFGGAIVCEPRYVEPIYFGAVQAGLAVQS